MELPRLESGADLRPFIQAYVEKRLPVKLADRIGECPTGVIKLRESTLSLRPAHLIALYGRVDWLKQLQKVGCALDVTDEWENTPLHYAALGCHRQAMQWLMNQGARVVENKLEGTPLDYLKYVQPKELTEECGYPLIQGDVHLNALMMLKWFLHVKPEAFLETVDFTAQKRFKEIYRTYVPRDLEIVIGRPDDEDNSLPPELGRRLFTKELISQGEIVAPYGGVSHFRVISDIGTVTCFDTDEPGSGGTYVALGVDGAFAGSKVCIAAHGTPNSGFSWARCIRGWPERGAIVALEDIPPGTEITLHYETHTINDTPSFREPRPRALKAHLSKELGGSEVDNRAWFHLFKTIPLILSVEREGVITRPKLLEAILFFQKRILKEAPVYEWMNALKSLLQLPDEKITQGFALLREAFVQLAELQTERQFEFYRPLSAVVLEIIEILKIAHPSSVTVILNERFSRIECLFPV